ncbi:hypothetical protein MKX03_002412 [Papaver bracteatum]|nr:hypothetical protein MKX03_002412 [Papaver bracteatum]
MGNKRRYYTKLICIFFTVTAALGSEYSSSTQFISTNQSITGTQTIVSSPEKFRLGFFSPANPINRYVGIWFNNVPGPTVVWVANRHNPLQDSSGVLKIGDDGNLVLVAGRNNVFWTSNVSTSTATINSRAQLLSTGNLVLQETINGSETIVWQSFDHPSNVFLPNMTFVVNKKTGEKRVITSWKDTENDPSTGNFTLELDPTGIPQSIIMDHGYGNQQRRYWRSIPTNLNGFRILTNNTAGSVYLTLDYSEERNILEKYTLTSDGNFVETQWNEGRKEWVEVWSAKYSKCDIYDRCGTFGSCNALDSSICSCLRGFVPKSFGEWSNGNWSGGCVRRTELQCVNRSKNETGGDEKNVSRSTISGGKEEADGFLKLENMKVPDFVERGEAGSAEECTLKCLQNCSCLACSYDRNVGCMWWSRDLVDVQRFGNLSQAGVELYIKVAHSELGTKKDHKIFIIMGVVIGIAVISLCTFFCWRRC